VIAEKEVGRESEGAEMIKERPIIFSGEMVKAILDGRKTQTRRVTKPQPEEVGDNGGKLLRVVPTTLLGPGWDAQYELDNPRWLCKCPYGQPGDVLWLRESFSFRDYGSIASPDVDKTEIWYWADGDVSYGNWTRPKPSIHMPRWASRILLDVVSVGVERVQDITEEDVVAEGAIDDDWLTWREDCANIAPAGSSIETPRDVFEVLWNKINAKRGFGWAVNPFVWRVEFRRAK